MWWCQSANWCLWKECLSLSSFRCGNHRWWCYRMDIFGILEQGWKIWACSGCLPQKGRQQWQWYLHLSSCHFSKSPTWASLFTAPRTGLCVGMDLKEQHIIITLYSHHSLPHLSSAAFNRRSCRCICLMLPWVKDVNLSWRKNYNCPKTFVRARTAELLDKERVFPAAFHKRQVYPVVYGRKGLCVGSGERGGSSLPAVRICSLGVCSLKTSLLLCVSLIPA